MREIKFRAWDKHREEMVEVGRIIFFPEARLKDWAQILPPFREVWSLVPTDCELMQFTGLKDKNGKEIYEGDIVRLDTPDSEYHKTRNKEIMFSQRFAQFCIEPCTSISQWPSVEVIGNIHENPERLGEK